MTASRSTRSIVARSPGNRWAMAPKGSDRADCVAVTTSTWQSDAASTASRMSRVFPTPARPATTTPHRLRSDITVAI